MNEALPDNFLIILNTTDATLLISGDVITKLANNIDGKLYILNFNQKKVNKDVLFAGIKKVLSSDKYSVDSNSFLKRVVYDEDLKKQFTYVTELCSNYSENDFVVIIGAERLVPAKEISSFISTDFNTLSCSFHSMDELNWEDFTLKVDELFTLMQDKVSGIVMILDIYETCVAIINNFLKDSSSMSIISVLHDDSNEYFKIQLKLMNDMKSNNLTDFLKILDNFKSELTKITYHYLECLAYIKNGNRGRAIDILEGNLAELDNREKILLADLYTSVNKYDDSLEILKEIYNQDRYEPNLIFSILRVINRMESKPDLGFWVKEALEVDGENPGVLEIAGNYYNSIEEYKSAAKCHRKIYSLLKNPHYELVARILDLIDTPPEIQDAESYIDQLLAQNQSISLENEANYRLGGYLIEYKNSIYSGYNRLKKVQPEVGGGRALDAVVYRMRILQDTFKASKALRKLKPYRKEKDADLLSSERVVELINGIPVLACHDKGFMVWEEFIEKAQTAEVWKKSIYNQLLELFIKWGGYDLSLLKSKSFISKLLGLTGEQFSIYDSIYILRDIASNSNSMHLKEENIDECIEGALIQAELEDSMVGRYWIRYYLSIYYSRVGRTQDANNHALTILYFANRDKNINRSKKYLMLGILAWGYSQYRIGKQVEGVACVVSAFEMGFEVEEVAPLIEQGVNILFKFINDNRELLGGVQSNIVTNFFNKMTLDDEIGYINNLILEQNWDELYNYFTQNMNLIDDKKKNWAIHLSHFITTCIQLQKYTEAYNLIVKYSDKAIEAYANRIDSRYKVLYSWADFVFFGKAQDRDLLKDYKLALRFLEISISDVEKKREVYHKTERASIGDSSVDIYKLYIFILVLFYNLKDISVEEKETMRLKIEKSLMSIVPRAILEQKQYYLDKEVTDEVYEIEKEYQRQFEELRVMQLNSTEEESFEEKKRYTCQLLDILKKNHPHYMPLESYTPIDFNEIKNSLKTNEVFYQIIRTKHGAVTLLLSNEEELFSPIFWGSELSILTNALAGAFQEDNISGSEMLGLCDILSEAYFSPLLNYLKGDSGKKNIYFMPDISIPYLSANIIRVEDSWLVENVDSIVNVLDYKKLLSGTSKSTSKKIVAKAFGQPGDRAMKQMKRWLDEYIDVDNIHCITDFSDDIYDFVNKSRSCRPEIVIVIGHGVSDPKADLFSGALAIKGDKKTIWIDELADIFNYTNTLIVISCSGGTPFKGQIETSTGIWGTIYESSLENIILCKWDAAVDVTIKMMRKFINSLADFDWDISKTLLYAQKEVLKEDKEPAKWAVLEYWRN